MSQLVVVAGRRIGAAPDGAGRQDLASVNLPKREPLRNAAMSMWTSRAPPVRAAAPP
jgi:hypothetical protein